jgi:hypothetical protein
MNITTNMENLNHFNQIANEKMAMAFFSFISFLQYPHPEGSTHAQPTTMVLPTHIMILGEL